MIMTFLQSQLTLNNLKSLDKTSAKILIQWKGLVLNLYRLNDVSNETAKILAQFEGELNTNEKTQELINQYK